MTLGLQPATPDVHFIQRYTGQQSTHMEAPVRLYGSRQAEVGTYVAFGSTPDPEREQ